MAAGRLALAIPANTVKSFLSGRTPSAWLGVSVSPVQVPDRRSGPFGLLILEIEEGSPAALASFLPGDILVGTEGRPFAEIEDLRIVLQGSGERPLRFEFLRGDYSKVRRVTVLLGTRPAERSRAA
jgi:S1-C subfamily serine protease